MVVVVTDTDTEIEFTSKMWTLWKVCNENFELNFLFLAEILCSVLSQLNRSVSDEFTPNFVQLIIRTIC